MRSFCRILFASFLLLISGVACVKTHVTGNGAAYQGGDPLLSSLETTRKALVETLSLLKGNQDPSLCLPQGCQGDTVVCNELERTTAGQQQYCRDFIFGTLDQIIYLNTVSPPVDLSISAVPLSTLDTFGKAHDMFAMTQLGPAGGIIFDKSAVQTLPFMELLSLMMHENCHKVRLAGTTPFVTDNDPFPPFDTGRILNDTLGAAVASYANLHKGILPSVALVLGATSPADNLENRKDVWQPTDVATAPSARQRPLVAWTGSKMLVLGGNDLSSQGPMGGSSTLGGGLYDPPTDTWTPISNAPSMGTGSAGVWTGNQLVIWGGNGFISGGRFNPSSMTWQSLSTVNAPVSRQGHSAVWTGSQIIIFGGKDMGIPSSTMDPSIAVYQPSTDSWQMSLTSGPVGRENHSAIWTGKSMVIWGGDDGTNVLNSGAIFVPQLPMGSWKATTLNGAPPPMNFHSTVWTGREMIVWGGGNGWRYDPNADRWTPVSTTNAPSNRKYPSAVWTGSTMILWGGISADNSTYLNDGGIYDPGTDTWAPLSMTNAPQGRYLHGAVWTGTQMVIWGGFAGQLLNSGGAYFP